MLKLFQRLENPERPLMGPNQYWLEFWGMLLPKKFSSKLFCLFLHIMVIIFAITEFVDIWFVRTDLNLLLTNVKVSMISAVSVTKVITFFVWQKHWKNVLEYATKSDLNYRTQNYIVYNNIINKYTIYSRKITYSYWTLVFTTVIVVCSQPFVKYFSIPSYRENVRLGIEPYTQVVSSWVPFDKSTVWGYLVASAYQSYATIFAGGWITSFDTNSMVLMVFFGGQVDLLRARCGRIFGTEDNPVSDDEAKTRIVECHFIHVELIKYAKLFDSLLSPIMLLYMFVCSVMLCASAYQITLEASPMQRFLTTEYLLFGIAQLFIYCWHSNDVYYKSQELIRGPFESTWWVKKTSHRKNLVLLNGQLNKTIVFTAGPFMNLTVPTFISILKGAYSYYTLLRKA